MTENATVDLSVVIPTHNRAKSLSKLLASLRNTDGFDLFRMEVIVDNNDCQDDTLHLLDNEGQRPTDYDFKILTEKRRGKASALNCGLKAARGSVILVIDDDVVVEPATLRMHLDCYRLYPYDAVQGRILPGVDPLGNEADPRRLREYNIPYIDYGDSVRQIRGLTGTNMSFKREVFETVGTFDPRLGPGASGFSEDTEFSRRVRSAGFKIGYTPHAVVYHELDPARFGRTYNRMVEYRKGQSRSIYRQDSLLTKVIPNLIANCLRYILYKIVGRTQKAYKTEGRILKCCGQLVGTLELRSRRNIGRQAKVES
jgi:GT2 family glycosyltransferase